MSENDAPECSIVGARKLTDVYGYWISFHDATVENVLIERQGPTVTICFETCDMATSMANWSRTIAGRGSSLGGTRCKSLSWKGSTRRDGTGSTG